MTYFMVRKTMLSILTALFSSLFMPAQNRIPDWFFDSNSGSQIGVSFPAENHHARECMALMIAVLQNRCVQANCHENAVISGKDIRARHSFADQYKFSYQLENRHVNDNDEEFIKVKITDGNDCSINIAYVKDFEILEDNSLKIDFLCRIELETASGLKSVLLYDFKHSQASNDFCHHLEFLSCTPQGETYILNKEINKANYASYKYQNCRETIDFSLSASCENSLFVTLLQITLQGEMKQVLPIGVKDNYLHFLYY